MTAIESTRSRRCTVTNLHLSVVHFVSLGRGGPKRELPATFTSRYGPEHVDANRRAMDQAQAVNDGQVIRSTQSPRRPVSQRSAVDGPGQTLTSVGDGGTTPAHNIGGSVKWRPLHAHYLEEAAPNGARGLRADASRTLLMWHSARIVVEGYLRCRGLIRQDGILTSDFHGCGICQVSP